jgi:hypothetical protein
MTTEFLLLWCHFIWPCIAIVLLISCIGHEIRKSMASVGSSSVNSSSIARNEIKKSQRRLIQMAFTVGTLCLIQLGANIWSSEVLDAWNTASELDLDCQFQAGNNLLSRRMEYGFTSGQKICEASDNTLVGRECTGACHYLLFPMNWSDTQADYQMYCEVSKETNLKEEFSRLVLSEGGTYLQFRNNTTHCSCPCSKMVNPKTPPVK